MAMSKAVYVVYSRPSAPEREADFNDWYDHTHLGEVGAVPGVTGARRFRLAGAGNTGAGPALPEYLALYEIDADDPAETVAAIGKGVASGAIKMTDAIELDPLPITVLYQEL
jgi:hypothetical protein